MSEPQVIRDSELSYDSDLVCTLDGEPFSGIAYEESPRLGRSEICYRNGIQDGPARDWYPSGGLKGQSNFVQGVLHGTSSEFGENGQLVTKTRYEYGIRVRAQRFGADGEVTATEELDPNDAAANQLRRLRAEHGWEVDG